jgi:hypothetical protein
MLELQNNTLDVSVISGNKNGLDKDNPFTFKQWLTYSNEVFTTPEIFLGKYKNYLTRWYTYKNNLDQANKVSLKDLYVNLLNEITLNYITPDEKRFISNVDFNNPREIATVIPFYAKKIKEICIYYSSLRDDVKTASVKNNLRGSNFGIKKGVYNEISKALEADDLIEIIKTLNVSLSDIRNNISVEVEELYDTSNSYFDISPNVSLTAYNPSGERKEYFNLNVYNSDPYITLDFARSVVQAMTSYPFFLTELGTNNFVITPTVSSSKQFYYLKDKDFINTFNTETDENLNLNNEELEIEKYIGTDFYYVSTGSTINNFLSGVVYKAKNSYANYLNKRYPTVAAVANESNTSIKHIGGFFKPDKLGLATFTSFDFKPFFDKNNLASNSVYIFPDPEKYGNVESTTFEEFNSPFKFVEYNYFNKINIANQYRFGDVYTDSKLQTFRAYQSRDQSLEYSDSGIHRRTDPQDFFKTHLKNVWANEDIYKLVPADKFPIYQRQKTLINTFKNLVQFKSDVYGNNYGLFKFTEPLQPLPTTAGTRDVEGLRFCSIVNGGQFDPFVYEFALKTTTNIPPGTGYYVPYSYTNYYIGNYSENSPLSTFFYNNGVPSYNLPENEFENLISYVFQPEIFCSEFVIQTFDCNFKDGHTFVSNSSAKLIDYPSDNPSFNPAATNVYYSELIDGGANPAAPGYRPVYGFAADFTFKPPLSALTNVDGSFLLINGESPCGRPISFNEPLYTERSNFINLRVPGRLTTYLQNITTISQKQSIYQTNFINYGDFYFRNANSTIIEPVSSALSALFIKYYNDKNNNEVVNEINNKLINFDVYYDVLLLETENYVIFEKINFDFNSGTLRNVSNTSNLVYKGRNRNFENTSTVFFSENEKKLYVASFNLYPVLSGSIYKTVTPSIYSYSLLENKLLNEYPNSAYTNYIFPENNYTLMSDSTNLCVVSAEPSGNLTLRINNNSNYHNININYFEKPLFSFNTDNNTFVLTFIGKDTSDFSYIFKYEYRYINGILNNVSTNMYMPSSNMLHIAFGLSSSYFELHNLPSYFKPHSVLNWPGNLNIKNGTYEFGVY